MAPTADGNFNVMREWRRVLASSASAKLPSPPTSATTTSAPTSTPISTSAPASAAEQIRKAEIALFLAIRPNSKRPVGDNKKAKKGRITRFLARTTAASVEVDNSILVRWRILPN